MLSLFFTEKLDSNQDELIFDELAGFPKFYEHDGSDFDTKISAFVRNRQLAEEIVKKLMAIGLNFGSSFHPGSPFFDESFYKLDEKPLVKIEMDAVLSESVRNPDRPHENAETNVPEQFVPRHRPEMRTPNQQLDSTPQRRVSAAGDDQSRVNQRTPDFVTMDQLKEFSIRHSNNLVNQIKNEWMQQMKGMMASSSSQSTPVTPTAPSANISHTKSAGYAAKNELVANGIRCEKCSQVVKGYETIGLMMDAVRDHVLIHFDKENPLLKRFECRECGPTVRTNFVSEFEKHLGKHDKLRSLPEKRNQLTLTLLTTTHLNLITKLCNECFPDVFEKVPPMISNIKAVDVPSKARLSIFPNLDQAYCFQYKIPDKCGRRNSMPVPVVQLH